MLNKERLSKVATYKLFEKGSSGKWHVSSVRCYTNGFQYIVIVSIYGSRHCHEHVFNSKNRANAFVKDYMNMGFRRVNE